MDILRHRNSWNNNIRVFRNAPLSRGGWKRAAAESPPPPGPSHHFCSLALRSPHFCTHGLTLQTEQPDPAENTGLARSPTAPHSAGRGRLPAQGSGASLWSFPRENDGLYQGSLNFKGLESKYCRLCRLCALSLLFMSSQRDVTQ